MCFVHNIHIDRLAGVEPSNHYVFHYCIIADIYCSTFIVLIGLPKFNFWKVE